jgi:hypothetical protein
MKYLCLMYHGVDDEPRLSAEEHVALIRETLAYDQELVDGGHMIESAALQGPGTAKTIKVRKGKAIVSDGPFVESKEYVGGFFFLEANDLEEAIEIVSKIPPARIGVVELRPVRDFTPEETGEITA